MGSGKLVVEQFFFFFWPKHPLLHFPITKKKFCSSQRTWLHLKTSQKDKDEFNFVPQPP